MVGAVLPTIPRPAGAPKRRGRDSNPRNRWTRLNGFQDRRIQPLCHPSGRRRECQARRAPRLLGGGDQADRAGDARASEAAVAGRVLGQVLLVVVLGVVEGPAGAISVVISRDPAAASRLSRSREATAAAACSSETCRSRSGTGCPCRCPAACPGSGRAPPRSRAGSRSANLGRVEDDQHRLRVAGRPAADLLVGRVRRVAAGIADGRRVHAGRAARTSSRRPRSTPCRRPSSRIRPGTAPEAGSRAPHGSPEPASPSPAPATPIRADHLRLLPEQEHD